MQLIDETRKLDPRTPNTALGTNGHELMISSERSKIPQEEEPLQE